MDRRAEQKGAASTSRQHSAFFGPHGMRAGWSLLIYVLTTQAIGAALFFGIQRIWAFPTSRPGLLAC